MRVGSGNGFGFEGGEREFSSEKRRRQFRARHVLGQEVEGEVLKEIGSGLFWVEVGGFVLSARLPFEARPGQRLLMRIDGLEPEILLKFVKQLHGAAGAVEVQAYTSMRGSCDTAWNEFLLKEFGSAGLQKTGELEKPPDFKLGEPFSDELVSIGEQGVSLLLGLWEGKFLSGLDPEAGGKIRELTAIQKSHVRSLETGGVRAWMHIPWAGFLGRDKELLLIQEEGQKLEKMLISGVWPKIGGAFITGLCLNGEMSLRVAVQGEIPFEEAAPVLNLAGLGQVLRAVKEACGLSPWLETGSITCLEYCKRPPDTVPGILLRMRG